MEYKLHLEARVSQVETAVRQRLEGTAIVLRQDSTWVGRDDVMTSWP